MMPVPARKRSSSPDVTRVLAALMSEAITLADAAALLGEDESQTRARLTNLEVVREAFGEATRMRLSGELAQLRAASMLPRALTRIEQLLDDPDASHKSLIDATKELGLLSGAKPRAETQSRLAAANASGALVIGAPGDGLLVINMPGPEVPSPPEAPVIAGVARRLTDER